MPIMPLREVGKVGVITDTDPFELPLEACSFAKNVRFENNKISRGSVFRKVGDLSKDPKHLIGYLTQSGTAQTLFVASDGSINEYGGSDRSIAGYVPAASTAPVTSCVLNNVLYVNRSDRLPWYRPKDLITTAFTAIPTTSDSTQWHADWRCRVLRSLQGVLVAANVSKGASNYPNMVKWSNFSIEPNVVPPDWDYNSTTSNAGENHLTEMQGQILEAFPLRNRLYLYGDVETWMMEFIGGNDMFRFDRQFDQGIINTNAVAEVGGIHYVFGDHDIWMHDGTSDKPLATAKVRNFIYRNMRPDETAQAFVTVNRRTNEVIFCYVSSDSYTKFPAVAGRGCNRAAIYNYSSGTWSFADLPYVTCASQVVISSSTSLTFDSASVDYLSIGGSFAQLELSVNTNLAMAGYANGAVTRSLRTYEEHEQGSTSFNLDTSANAGAYIERVGIDLDEVGAELRGYKLISSIYPQARLGADAQALVFTVGIKDHPNDEPSWEGSQTYDRTYYKLDYNLAGRYLAYKIEQTDFEPFTINGYDFDVALLGQF